MLHAVAQNGVKSRKTLRALKNKDKKRLRVQKNGASEGIRTLDTHVGNVMLYQAELRSLPEAGVKLQTPLPIASPLLNAKLSPGLS